MVDLKSTKDKEESHEKAAQEAPKAPEKAPADKAKELTEMCQRVQADFENYKKHVQKETEERRQQAKGELISGFLPILDSFEMALKSKASLEEFRKGVELIYSQMVDMMRKEGLTPIKALGQKFDPYRHEALLIEKTEKHEEDEKITEELQKGYLLKDKVLWYAKVRILEEGVTMEQKINLSISEGKAFFAHEASINYSPTQFILDFKCVTPRIDPRSTETANIHLEHEVILLDTYHALRLHELLGEMLKKYEKDFGKIEKPKQIEKAEKKAKQDSKAEKQDLTYFG